MIRTARLKTAILLALPGLTAVGIVFAQAPFKEYPAIEYENFPLPSDWSQKSEWTRARLRYPDVYGYPDRNLQMNDGRPFPGFWTMDYPRSDRHLLEGVRRLTRIDSRSVEQIVSLDGTDEIYNWPTLYAVEVGHWRLPDEQAAQLREYLLRGGFLMVDDFHADPEWRYFMTGLHKVFPDREPKDIPNDDPIFHTIYDLAERFQVPGAKYFDSGLTYENGDSELGGTFEQGKTPHWKGIYDNRGRLMVAICHNMDLGDAWEHSDEARYQEKWASLAYRIAMNYFVYDLTH
jgi:hypothetical protein